MYSLFNQKKGVAVDDFFPLLFVMIIFVIGILIFAVANNKKEVAIKEEIKNMIDSVEYKHNLLDFLRTPVNENENMADLITQSYLNNDFDELTRRVRSYFNEAYGEKTWILEIHTPDKLKKIGLIEKQTKTFCTSKKLLAKAKIPTIDQATITLELFIAREYICG